MTLSWPLAFCSKLSHEISLFTDSIRGDVEVVAVSKWVFHNILNAPNAEYIETSLRSPCCHTLSEINHCQMHFPAI